MRRLFIGLFLLLFFAEAYAQTPDRMAYQVVVRRTNNQLVNEETVGMQISILQGNTTGTAVFVEHHSPQTDRNGVVSIEIGDGTISTGTLQGIDWANGPYFVRTEIDLDGGTNYTITGTSQLLTVPYANLANKAAELLNGEQDPLFQSSVAQGITSTDTMRWNASSVGLDSAGIAALGYVAGPHTTDTQIDSAGIANLGFVAGSKTVDSQIDSAGIAALGYVAGPKTVDTTLDSAGVASLGFVAGAHTVDTQIDSTGIANLGFIAGSKTVDTQIDSAGIAALGYVAGPKTVDTTLDSVGVASLGFVAGAHTVDTQIDSTGIANLGFTAGPHTTDTQIDSTGIANLGYVAGPKTVDTTLDSAAIAAMGFVANPQLLMGTESDPVYSASPAGTITTADIDKWNTNAADDMDNDPTNEIQTLSYANGTITLSNGGGSVNVNLIPVGFWATAPLHPGTGGTPSTTPCALACPDGYAPGANANGNNCRTPTGSEGRHISATGFSYTCGILDAKLSLCFCVKID